MNKFSEEKIKELNAIPLIKSKEWMKSLKKLEGRQVYWAFKQKIYTLQYICPMTRNVWFTERYNGWSSQTNAVTEMYLIPKIKPNGKT